MSNAEQIMHQVTLDLAKTLGVIRTVEHTLIDSRQEHSNNLGLTLGAVAHALEQAIITLDTA